MVQSLGCQPGWLQWHSHNSFLALVPANINLSRENTWSLAITLLRSTILYQVSCWEACFPARLSCFDCPSPSISLLVRTCFYGQKGNFSYFLHLSCFFWGVGIRENPLHRLRFFWSGAEGTNTDSAEKPLQSYGDSLH